MRLFSRYSYKGLFSFFIALGYLVLFSNQAMAQHWTSEEEGIRTIWYVEKQEIEQTFVEGISPILWSYQAFVRLGVRWDASSSVKLFARFSKDAQTWGAWTRLKDTFIEGIVRNSHIDTPSKGRYYMQLRFKGHGKVTFLAAETIVKLGPHTYPDYTQDSSQKSSNIGQSNSALSGLYHPRSDWKAAPTKCTYLNTKKTMMAIHHTVSPNNDTVPVESRLRGFQNYHQKTKGWCDIGYHFLVSADGRLWEGRTAKYLGAHVRNHNTNNLGISFIGTFMTFTPAKTMLCAGSKMIDWAAKTYKITRNRTQIKGHREYSGANTTCPGDVLLSKISSMITWASNGNCTSSVPDSGTIRGVVFDAKDASMKIRVIGALVKLSNGKQVTTDSLGAFSFVVPVGTYKETASKTGYKTNTRSVVVIANKTVWASIGLTKGTNPTDTKPPKLMMIQPKNNTVIHQAEIVVEGVATDETALDKVLVNGHKITVDSKGHFKVTEHLHLGIQQVIIEAKDKASHRTIVKIQVTYSKAVESKPEPQVERLAEPSVEPIKDASTKPEKVLQHEQKDAIEQKGNYPRPPDMINNTDKELKDQIFVVKNCKGDSDCKKGQKCINQFCKDVPPKSGCGCQMTPSRVPFSLILLFLLVFLAVPLRYSRHLH